MSADSVIDLQDCLGDRMNSALLNYYEAIEQASQDMLEAARIGNWDHVVKLEGACALLISQLKHAASKQKLAPEEAEVKSQIMQRILLNDAAALDECARLIEPLRTAWQAIAPIAAAPQAANAAR